MYRKNILTYLLVIFIFLSVAFLAYSDLFLELSTKIPGGRHRDALFHLSIINWTLNASLADVYHLPFFYPLAYLRAANQPLFFQSVFFKILGWIGANTEVCNNLYIIFAWLVGAFGCFLLCREFTSDFFFPLIFSSIYIIHQLNFMFIKWINFISPFFFPYILYFSIQYLKSNKDKYAIIASFLLVLQIMASLFYGFYSWIFFIPLIFLSSFLLRLISVNEIKNYLFYLLIGGIIVFVCFSPYLDSQSRLIGSGGLKIHSENLLTGDILFYYSKILDSIFENTPRIGIYYFPGFVFLFFVLAYAVSFIDRRKLKYSVLASLYFLSILISLFVYINRVVMDYLFLLLILGVFLTIFLNWKKVARLEKAILLCFSLFFLIFVYFPHIPILKAISVYSLIQYFFPILGAGLRASSRIFFILAPFMVFFASLGALRLFQLQKAKKIVRQKKLHNVKFQYLDIMNLGKLHNKFDAAFSIAVNCHLPDKVKALKNIYKILKQGGRLVISDYLQKHTLNPFEKELLIEPFNHYWCYPYMESVEGYKKILKEVGFTIIKARDVSKQVKKNFDIYYDVALNEIKTMNYKKMLSYINNPAMLKNYRKYREIAKNQCYANLFGKICLEAGVFRYGYFVAEK